MSLPPKKPNGPPSQAPIVRLELKRKPKDGGPAPTPSAADFTSGHAASSSASSSSTSIHPAPRRPGAPKLPADDAYDSSTEPDDLPQSYFEAMSRERDRKHNRDRQDRKKQRLLAASGWPHTEPVSPASYVRSEQFTFMQPTGYCKAAGAAFIQLRYRGLSVPDTIKALKRGAIADALPQFNDVFKWVGPGRTAATKKNYIGNANALHAAIAGWLRESRPLLPKESAAGQTRKPASLPAPPQPSEKTAFFEHLIGYFNAADATFPTTLGDWSSALAEDRSSFRVKPHVPASQVATTFQQSLFGAFQPAVKRTVPIPPAGSMQPRPVAAIPTLIRCATPYVSLSLQLFSAAGKYIAHSIVVDFSDPARPGNFDPNFGWMEPVQGFCILSLEQALTCLWQYYSFQESREAGRTGRALLSHKTTSGRMLSHNYILAFQVYAHTMVADAGAETKIPAG